VPAAVSLNNLKVNEAQEVASLEIEIPHNGLYKHEDNILVGVMYSLDTGEEAAAIDKVGPGVSDVRMLSGITALKLVRTPEAFAT